MCLSELDSVCFRELEFSELESGLFLEMNSQNIIEPSIGYEKSKNACDSRQPMSKPPVD